MNAITRRRFVGVMGSAGIAVLGLLAGCSGGRAPSSFASDAIDGGSSPAPSQDATTEGGTVLFINPSQNRDGNTARMAANLLDGIGYETLDLVDYKIYPLGAQFDDDQFEEVWRRMCDTDFLVWGTPVYWHTMRGP